MIIFSLRVIAILVIGDQWTVDSGQYQILITYH